MKTEFNILNLTKSASWDDIKKAYRDKMKENHPDLNNENTMMINEANRKSQDINAAYSKLKSCLTKTGRFICPTFDFKKKKVEPEFGQTNIVDFFQPRELVVEEEARASIGAIVFNIFLMILWAGVLILGTIKGIEYFETHSFADISSQLKSISSSVSNFFSK